MRENEESFEIFEIFQNENFKISNFQNYWIDVCWSCPCIKSIYYITSTKNKVYFNLLTNAFKHLSVTLLLLVDLLSLGNHFLHVTKKKIHFIIHAHSRASVGLTHEEIRYAC